MKVESQPKIAFVPTPAGDPAAAPATAPKPNATPAPGMARLPKTTTSAPLGLPPADKPGAVAAATVKLEPAVSYGFLGRLIDAILSLFGAGKKDDLAKSAAQWVRDNPEAMLAARAEYRALHPDGRPPFEEVLSEGLAVKILAKSPGLSPEEASEIAQAMTAQMIAVEQTQKDTIGPAHTLAGKLGEPFQARMADLEKKAASSDPKEAAEAKAAISRLLVLMVAHRDGVTKGIPASAIKEWVELAVNPPVGSDPARLVAFVNTLSVISPEMRAEIADRLEHVPADRRGAVMMVIANETMALHSTNAGVREKAWKRINKACDQAATLDPVEFKKLSGVLGLEKIGEVKVSSGGKEISLPVYAHPGVGPAERETALKLYGQALKAYPFPLIEKLAAGDNGVPLSLTIEPHASIFTSGDTRIGGYDTHTKTIRLSAAYMRTSGALAKSDTAKHDLIHEMGHAVDDMLQPGVEDEMSAQKGSLLGAHFETANHYDDPGVLGMPSTYAKNGRGEYFAECMAFYANGGKDRATLQARDPVAYAVCERFFALTAEGKTEEARRLITFGSQPPESIPTPEAAADVHALTEGYAVPVKAFNHASSGGEVKKLRAKELDGVIGYVDKLIAAANPKSGPDYESLVADRARLAKLRKDCD